MYRNQRGMTFLVALNSNAWRLDACRKWIIDQLSFSVNFLLPNFIWLLRKMNPFYSYLQKRYLLIPNHVKNKTNLNEKIVIRTHNPQKAPT